MNNYHSMIYSNPQSTQHSTRWQIARRHDATQRTDPLPLSHQLLYRVPLLFFSLLFFSLLFFSRCATFLRSIATCHLLAPRPMQRAKELLTCLLLAVALGGIMLLPPAPAFAQDDSGIVDDVIDDAESALEAPEQVDVQPVARDEEIAERVVTIMRATEWFRNPSVTVRDGVVFLDGQTLDEEYRTWAGNLARNTQDAVAVVNRIEIIQRSPWDFTPALVELRRIGRESLQILPLILFGILILILAWSAMRYASRLADRLLRQRVTNNFLRNLATTAISIPVFLLGLYLVLQVSGLTRLAVTVLGGTGIAGLIVGIGFRDIMENFLATVLISTRNPFKTGDRIEVDGRLGIVQQVNSRTTVLMSLEGNHIQIPNAVVYKSTIRNFTANPKQRLEFTIGIGYEDNISAAQQTVIDVLTNHPAILQTPEPLVLVNGLGASTVNLRVLFWLDTSYHEEIKVRSSAIRLVKRALDDGGFTMPDEAREVIFPEGVPLRNLDATATDKRRELVSPTDDASRAEQQRAEEQPPNRPQPTATTEPLATQAEGGLASEDEQIKEQARTSRNPEEDTNLLQE